MLENTKIWAKGPMNLYINRKPSKVYVTSENVQKAFNSLKNTLAKNGSIPLGIDHLQPEVIENNSILKKLDLLHVGDIYDVDYDKSTDSIFITSATLSNPLLQQLYNDGELSSVSIVATSSVNDCPQKVYDFVLHETNITRVDIVGQGACETCIIPNINNNLNEDTVYARLPINKESQTMAEDNKPSTGLTAEEIQDTIKTAFSEATKPFDERLKKIEEKVFKEDKPQEPNPNDDEGMVNAGNASEELQKIEEARKELAVTAVDVQIQAGKVLPSQKEAMVELATKDMVNFTKMMDEQPAIVDLAGRQSNPAGEDNDDSNTDLTAEEINMNEVTSYFNKE